MLEGEKWYEDEVKYTTEREAKSVGLGGGEMSHHAELWPHKEVCIFKITLKVVIRRE